MDVSARLVGQYLFAQAVAAGESVTNLKLQKLVYYSYASVLTLCEERLFFEPIEAWRRGPVVKNLYHDLKAYKSSPIDEEFLSPYTVDETEMVSEQFDFEVQFVLDGVCRKYMPLSAFALSDQTHVEAPWFRAWNREGNDKRIFDDDILEFFRPRITLPIPAVVGEPLRQELLSDASFIESACRGIEEN